jgi:hypothetical protein
VLKESINVYNLSIELMITNLFTYATKELSQDAFICWLLANHDNDELQEESYRFLDLLMNKDFSVGDIKLMTIKQQERKMDIVIDLWTSVSKCYDSHYVLVVEDKTTSSAHEEQLANYNKIIDEWNKNEPGFELRTKKVFFKSNTLSPQDEKEILRANSNTPIKWKKLDLEDLHKGFFKDAKKRKSEIFNMYIDYFSKLYNDIKFPPTIQPSSWNFNNWRRFFESFFKEEYEKKYPGSWCETSIYRGMYPSLRVIFPLISDCEFYANFEIIQRTNLVPYLHPGFRYEHHMNGEKTDRWVWSVDDIIDDEPFKNLSEKRLISLRKYVSENGGDLFIYSGKSRSFARIGGDKHISYDGKTIEQLKTELRVWLDTFFDVLSEYKNKMSKENKD